MKKEKNLIKIAMMHGYGERLKQVMDYRGINQTQLARQAGLSQPEISYYLRGKAFPRIPVSQKIAYVLGCSYQCLAYGIGECKYYTELNYPICEFQRLMHEGLSFLLWTHGVRQLDFIRECGDKAAPYWFEEERIPVQKSLDWICSKFECSPEWFLRFTK